MYSRSLLAIVLCCLSFLATAQEQENSLKVKGSLSSRYMSTNNEADLADFNTAVAFGHLKFDYKTKSWLSFSAQFNGLFIPSTKGVEKRDAQTGMGPIYEAGLFNLRTMDGNSEFTLPILNVQIELVGHFITVGRFLKDSQIFRTEQWPFPNALEGVWYENYTAEKASWQLAYIHRLATRFSGNFEFVGESIGVAPTGLDENGSPSLYRGNIDSKTILVSNYNRLFGNDFSIDFWNYYVNNVTNTVLIEPKLNLSESSITFSAKAIYQVKVKDGGNANQDLTYQSDDQAFYFGARVEKLLDKGSLQLNFSRITDDGRMLLPREWGIEPYYTFQRRTRIEGTSDAWAVMLRWENSCSNAGGKYRFYTSVAHNEMPDVADFKRNKYHLPSHVHWDASLKFQPTKILNGLSAEVLMAKRFLTADVNGDLSAIINRADFFHFDFILNYSFHVK